MSLLGPQIEVGYGSRILRRETVDFGIVEEFIWREFTRMCSIFWFYDMGMPMLILLAKTCPQLLYSATNSIHKNIKFIRKLYYQYKRWHQLHVWIGIRIRK